LRLADFFDAERRDDFRRPPLRADDFFIADFFRPPDRRPRRPLELFLPRDDRFFVAIAMLSHLRVGCSHDTARIARTLHL
jgi:hypothetical protein